MSILHKLVLSYPKLPHKLEESIQEVLETRSAGMKGRGKKILQYVAKKGLIQRVSSHSITG